jgi:hypothetical protein
VTVQAAANRAAFVVWRRWNDIPVRVVALQAVVAPLQAVGYGRRHGGGRRRGAQRDHGCACWRDLRYR